MRTNRSHQMVMDGPWIQRPHPLFSPAKKLLEKNHFVFPYSFFIFSFLLFYPSSGRYNRLLDISLLDYSGPTRKEKNGLSDKNKPIANNSKSQSIFHGKKEEISTKQLVR